MQILQLGIDNPVTVSFFNGAGPDGIILSCARVTIDEM
jgi:hypothetical protein